VKSSERYSEEHSEAHSEAYSEAYGRRMGGYMLVNHPPSPPKPTQHTSPPSRSLSLSHTVHLSAETVLFVESRYARKHAGHICPVEVEREGAHNKHI
jgi:hypothetical protein